MITLADIMERIALPEEAKRKLEEMEQADALGRVLPGDLMERYTGELTEEELWEAARSAVKEAAAPDEGGWKMLFVMLQAARKSYEKYRQQGISDKIFADTMSCFTRFIGEYRQIYGKYGFDRDFWTGRQLSLQLFRVGELEYEKTAEKGEKVISIHIPSDAVITEENCQRSIQMAHDFFKIHDEEYAQVRYCCDSWLLSPALRQLLPDTSKIIRFQKLFTIQSVDEGEESGIYWIFKRGGEDPQTLPETTTLQKNAKQYILSGGKIGSGKGYLKLVIE